MFRDAGICPRTQDRRRRGRLIFLRPFRKAFVGWGWLKDERGREKGNFNDM